jgi:hypothetical protein
MGGGARPRFKAHEWGDIVKMGGIGQGYKAPPRLGDISKIGV